MDNILPKIKEICRIWEIKPARSKGQNFLISDKIYEEIVAVADLNQEDLVLEVGPGLGFLTMKLAQKAKEVIAVELDDRLAKYLQTGLAAQGGKNIRVFNQDILRFNLNFFTGKKYQVVANLPYNITSIFLRQFLEAANPPSSLILMLQKEVAARICAVPPEMSLLAVAVQYYGQPRIIRTVKAGNFWPEPEVDSALIKIEVFPRVSRTSPEEAKRFFRLVKFGFSAKRKMLKNNLAAGLKIDPKIIETSLNEAGFNLKIRAEELSVDEWRKLFAALAKFVV